MEVRGGIEKFPAVSYLTALLFPASRPGVRDALRQFPSVYIENQFFIINSNRSVSLLSAHCLYEMKRNLQRPKISPVVIPRSCKDMSLLSKRIRIFYHAHLPRS
jgi:hypothetical protein